MRIRQLLPAASLALVALVAWSCNNDSKSVTGPSRGFVHTTLADAPFPSDSVDSVNVFVTRVEIRAAAADSAEADSATTSDSAAAHGWIVIASPGRVFDLLALSGGSTADLGTDSLAAGHYTGLRLVIDPAQSSVVLKNGMRLTGTSTPNVSFPSGSSSGLKINLTGGFDVTAADTTTLAIDFNLDQSFVLRGNSITQLGLLFKPVIQATIVN